MGHAYQQSQTQSMDASGGGILAAAGTTQSHTRLAIAAYYRVV
jgi:hypothetical protein